MSVAALCEVSVTRRGEGRVIRFYADEMEIKSQSGGVDVLDITANAGCEPPLHVHESEDESFFILEGEVTFYTADGAISAGPGTQVYAPRGIAHTYAVESGVARMIVTASPSGFVEMLDAVNEEFGGAMPATPSPEHFPLLGATLARFGVSIVGPNPGAA